VYVERHGTGAEAYFGLHGWGGDRNTFAPLAPHVPARASLYCADLPACGRSPAPSEWTPEALAEEVARAVTGLGVGAVTLVGNCGGAVFAMLAAGRLGPSLVSRVVMIDPFAYLPRYFRLFASEQFGRRAYEATFANPFGRWLTNQSLRGRRSGTADLTASFAAADHEAARRYLAVFDQCGTVERFRGFAAPVDIAHGERSFGAVKKSLALWRGALPQARVTVLAGAGHMPITEATSEVASLLFGRGSAGEWEGAGAGPGGGLR